jgi:hypothetical protein
MQCGSQDKCPGFILTNSTAPGCYMACHKMDYDKSQVFYLLAHPKLAWIPTNITHMMTLPGTLKVTGGNYPFLFGRSKDNGIYQVGKIHAGSGVFQFAYQMAITGRSICINVGFEVLICEP